MHCDSDEYRIRMPLGEDNTDRERWDAKYGSGKIACDNEPIAFLREHLHLLPRGKVIDLATGVGRNGVFLATHGFDVIGMDISAVGLKKAARLAELSGVAIQFQLVDLEQAQFGENEYDVILMIYYLQRNLFPQIKRALNSGGMVLVETYNQRYARHKPSFRKEYMLRTNELLEVFDDFEILRYQDVDEETTAYSSILARKPFVDPCDLQKQTD